MKSKDLITLQREQGRWSDRTFPGETVQQKIQHLAKEVQELLAHPTSREEMADCQLLLLDIARLQNTDANLLVSAAFDKLEINKRRTWAMGPDGFYIHVKPSEAEAA